MNDFSKVYWDMNPFYLIKLIHQGRYLWYDNEYITQHVISKDMKNLWIIIFKFLSLHPNFFLSFLISKELHQRLPQVQVIFLYLNLFLEFFILSFFYLHYSQFKLNLINFFYSKFMNNCFIASSTSNYRWGLYILLFNLFQKWIFVLLHVSSIIFQM